MDVVRNLCQFVAQLPEQVRNTKRLSDRALAVRDVILAAREPVKMVFHHLPEACGFPKFEIGKSVSTKQAQDFVEKLNQTMQELRAAYPALLQRIEESLADEFGYKGQSLKHFRMKLASRSEQLLVRVTESKLKAFIFRLFESTATHSEWLNSIGSVLALRPADTVAPQIETRHTVFP